MNPYLPCIPCVINQIARLQDKLDWPPDQSRSIMKAVLKKAAETEWQNMTAPEFSALLYREVTALTGQADLFQEIKRQQNALVRGRLNHFRQAIGSSGDSLRTAGLYALLGNIIDLGGTRLFDHNEIFDDIGNLTPHADDYPSFCERLSNSRNLLYIGDNAGEAVLDGLFITELKKARPLLDVTFAARGEPAINDVTVADARDAGLSDVSRVIASGSSCAGTVVPHCSREFRELFDAADIVISKGQGNYETLEREEREIFFIFKVKCDVVSRHLGRPPGTLIFSFGRSLLGASHDSP